MHAISLVWPIGTSIAGIFLESFAPLALYQGCWRTGSSVNRIAWVFVGPWLFSSYTIIPIIFVMIYQSARKAYRGSLFRQRSQTRQDHLSSPISRQARRLQVLRCQACFYVLAFFATYSFLVAVEITEAYSVHPRALLQRIYPLLLFQSIMTPLAGFFNSIVFLRPRYLHFRDQYNSSDSLNASTMFLALEPIRCLSQGSLSHADAKKKKLQERKEEPKEGKHDFLRPISLHCRVRMTQNTKSKR